MKNTTLSRNFEKVLWFSSTLLLVVCVISLIDSQWQTFKVLVTSVIAIYLVLFLFLAGKVDLAAVLFCYLLLTTVIVANWINNGLRDTSLVLFPAIYFFTAMTITSSHLWRVFGISAIYIVFISVENHLGIGNYNFASQPVVEDISTGIQIVLFLFASVFLIDLHFNKSN